MEGSCGGGDCGDFFFFLAVVFAAKVKSSVAKV